MTALISGKTNVLTYGGRTIRKDRASMNEATAYEVVGGGRVLISYVSLSAAVEMVFFTD